ncbi:MAG: hypothetical protein ABJL44_04540 [Algibacter sp.]
MKQRLLTHKKTNKKLILFNVQDFEMRNPIKQYGHSIIVKQMVLNSVPKEEITGEKKFTATSRNIFQKALNDWLKLKGAYQNIKVPENLIQLLKTESKKDQEKLLDKFVLTPDVLTAFIFKAYHEFGFTLSQYTPKFSQKNVNPKYMPLAKIINCGTHWHCFFTTFNRLKREKTQLHYISSAFGVHRTDLVRHITSSESVFNLDHLPHITL